jgi:hypothetical protein
MNPANYNPSRAGFSNEDKQAECRAVLHRLGQLRALRVLDLRFKTSRFDFGPAVFRYRIHALPIGLSTGLDELSELKSLEQFMFHGHQNMIKRDVLWMIEHWPSLRLIDGGRLSTGGSRFEERMNSWDAGLARILNSHRIRTPWSMYAKDYPIIDWNDLDEDSQKPPYCVEDEPNVYEVFDIDSLEL